MKQKIFRVRYMDIVSIYDILNIIIAINAFQRHCLILYCSGY